MTFSDLGLSEPVLRAVSDAGYTTPTPIQEQAIPVVLTGRDVLGCAQTGTGKTASFTLPMIEILASGRARARMPRSLILEPTRELATQVASNFETYGKHHKLSMALLIGGESFADQQKALGRGVDVLIATPGRLLDLFERGKILLSDVKVLVIDEADRMLDMGFIPDVERIVGFLPPLRQTLFFSATMPPEIRRLADAFLSNPKEISVAPPASPAETVEQHLLVVDAGDKRDALRSLLGTEAVRNAIVFCNRKRDVDILVKSLVRHGFDAAALHGDMPQYKRTETLDRFRAEELKLLVASDVAARGLDIVHVSHVFNFDVPIHAEDYIHRIGRTGRAGRAGKAFTIAAAEDGRFVAAIEKMLGRAIPRVELPDVTGAELLEEGAEGARRNGRRSPAKRRAPVRDKTGGAEVGPTERRRAPRSRRRDEPGRDDSRREASGDEAARPTEAGLSPVNGAPANDDERPARRSAVARPRRPQPGRAAGDDDSPVAFGGHTPAFLLRPARATAR